MTPTPAIEARHVTVTLVSGEPIVRDVSFSVGPGEILGLVGESGSGKTTLSLTALGYARPGARVAGGEVRVLGDDVLAMAEDERRSRRGERVAYVPQDPGTALNPSLRVRALLGEMLRAHRVVDGRDARIAAVLAKVGLPTDRGFQRRFPHQLSGGQQQRLAIAVALICEPAVLVMDEPTTGLDVVTQSVVLDEVRRLCRDTGVAIVYVSHDLAVVAGLAHRIAVMYAGRVVEDGPTDELLLHPRHPYTLGLISSIPDHLEPRTVQGIPGIAAGVGADLPGCAFAPRCPQAATECTRVVPELTPVRDTHTVRCFRWRTTPDSLGQAARAFHDEPDRRPLLEVARLVATHRSRVGTVVAARNVSFSIGAEECVALVGESGSGKTTIARCIAGLHARAGGEVRFGGEAVAPLARDRSRELRRRVQIVFQNPYDSLNAKLTVQQSLERPLRLFRLAGRSGAAADQVRELLDQVRLPAATASRYPAELSGGERQRVAIARALAASPDLLICDEITSALDVSVQAAVLELLARLRRELGVAMLFISHDLGVVSTIADRVLVLEQGSVREQGPVHRVLAAPEHPYTRSLLDAAPALPRPEGSNHEPQTAGRA
jgi:peptide/nickel transport system ATP-binding protein